MACPYLPRTNTATPWAPPFMLMVDAAPSVCPGYSTTLPAVAEVVAAYPHWEHGTLRDHLGGTPSPALLDGLVALKGGMRDRDNDDVRKRAQNGGGL